MSQLFSPVTLGPLTLSNRIVIAPMCQYSAEDGRASDWHAQHLGSLAQSGAGLLILEATAVEPRGRISYADLGLWDDGTEAALAQVLASVRRWSPMPLGIQLGHAGRKASTARPWDGGRQLPADDARGWPTVAPSPLPFHANDPAPQALDEAGIAEVVAAFAASAVRAERLGFELIEIHAAHGYLLHQFLSPLSNRRTDGYGGSLPNRLRLLVEVFDAVREAVSDTVSVGVRISATDWVEGGWDVVQSEALAQVLDARGCNFLHVSSGGLDERQKISVGPGYQVPFAAAIKAKKLRMPVIAVGLITEPEQAESILRHNQADAIALARGILYDPRWPWHAAAALGDSVVPAPQYLRCEPREARNVFRAR
ncbi:MULTISPECIES: NADH:flavin oxidoreductase/NADH oxidase [Stenotrophomonas]|uniref:NADH:flavin oxidoreductase/NADH oxidase n=1 Tax=Stenotrophomonas TaxID=40323 RepID=UPI0009B28B18|nr:MULTISPECIES: NADH:flavin oxidoreductase/NADH oxidase [Stenotrophomonas]ELK2667146.1 NADH:flavin oxidoreductase/NADH oxidase [Stenotrophomonas maltophilia]MBH1378038.1 NADH:flavin oxidoreductase/NADH oxidase [Stenotrophomonas maltophilia]MBH1440811.1 NADH:flavin oxidoreductase/NADH oxidase [Stenotrophomonas maltophilia]MBH1560777.1 NADH:flavin oxidoreductase/NADH oxidase [Stenotrophomonas maltophilia]MBN4988004.1 NADH:flavin oxidoreductase/NADH oxidase [Stenotrophomonas maltophilia]